MPASPPGQRVELTGGVVEELIPVTPGLLMGEGWRERDLHLDLKIPSASRVMSAREFEKFSRNKVALRDELEGRRIALVGYVSGVGESLWAGGLVVDVGRRFDGKVHFLSMGGTECALRTDQRERARTLVVGDLVILVGVVWHRESIPADLGDCTIERHVSMAK
jgi:hypothetical protein